MNNFDLKKFLVENRLTQNSKIQQNENTNLAEGIAEAKQVGTVYHFTAFANAKRTLENGLMFKEDNQFVGIVPVDPKKKYSISVTRSSNFNGHNPWNRKSGGCRIVLDGDKISQRYKILPINVDNTWRGSYYKKKSDIEFETTRFDNWFEERIYSPSPGYLSIQYIKQIDIIYYKWDKISAKYMETLNNLNSTGIPINRVTKF